MSEIDLRQSRPHTIVVGGTRGIGLAIALAFMRDGHAVTVLGRHEPAPAALSDLKHIAIDLADRSNLGATVADILTNGGPLHNLLFCQRYRGVEDPWDGEWETSLTATRTIVDRAVPAFAEDGSRSIVAICSIAHNFVACEQPLSYHVAKAALRQLVRYYAVMLGPKKVRVNSISTGTVLKYGSSEAYYRRNRDSVRLYESIIPLGRLATAEDVAGAARFLCGPSAAFMTGQDIVLDGGLGLIWPEGLARRLSQSS